MLLADDAERLWGSYVDSSLSSAADGAPVRVAMNALAGILFLVFRKRFVDNDGALRAWSMLALASIACVPLLLVSLTAVDRLALYLLPLQIYVAGSITRVPVSKLGRTGLVLGVIFLYSAVLFVWLNFASHSGAWVPYNSVLWGV